MAGKTASIAVNNYSTTAQAQTPVFCTITFTNGDGVVSRVTSVTPFLYPPSGSASSGVAGNPGVCPVALAGGGGITVNPSNGTATATFQVTPMVPTKDSTGNQADQTWVVGAYVQWSTGETIAASTATVTVQHQP